ncbi:MAG: LamG-like jellyroll fold domain-containing protein, partial [Verrucomicrobiota bacterium]
MSRLTHYLFSFAATAAVFILAPVAGAQNLADGIQGFWPFDEGAGDTTEDLSGNGRNGVFTWGEPMWVEGKVGGALYFDNQSGVEIPDYYGIGGATPRTISAWVKTDVAIPNGNTVLVGWGLNQSGRRWHFKFEHTTQGIRTENQSGQNFTEDVTVSDGEWHHIASVLPDGGTTIGDVRLYVDGVYYPISGRANGAQTIDT